MMVVRRTIGNSKVDATRENECADAVETEEVEHLVGRELGAGLEKAGLEVAGIGGGILGSGLDVAFAGDFLRLLLAAEEGVRGPRHDAMCEVNKYLG